MTTWGQVAGKPVALEGGTGSPAEPTAVNRRLTFDDAGEIDCRYLAGNTAVDRVFHEAVAADVRAAQLSPAFRAYYALRGLVPLRARQLLQRHRSVTTSPRWCFPDAFVAALIAQLQSVEGELTIVHPWPDGADSALVLTHDVETADGLRNVPKVVELEESLGVRSSWNIVPHKYRVDRGFLRDLRARGFEVGVHGYNHDGRLFTSKAVFDQRVPAINAALEEFGAVGFRAPMVHRNLLWLQALDIQYDASCFDADPYQAMPGGVGSIWPFIAGRFVELPYTLPQDHILFIAQNQQDGRMWQEKLDYLVALRGMALMLTHPDYLDSERRLNLYRQFLVNAREKTNMWHALPCEVADWWRERDALSLERDSGGAWQVCGSAAGRARPVQIRAYGPRAMQRNVCSAAVGTSGSHFTLAIEWNEIAAVRSA